MSQDALCHINSIFILLSRIAEYMVEESSMSLDGDVTISNFHSRISNALLTIIPSRGFAESQSIKPQTKTPRREQDLLRKLIVQVLIRAVIYKRHALSCANSQLTPKSSRISQTCTNRFVESPFNIVFQSDFTYTMNYAQLAMVFTQ